MDQAKILDKAVRVNQDTEHKNRRSQMPLKLTRTSKVNASGIATPLEARRGEIHNTARPAHGVYLHRTQTFPLWLFPPKEQETS